MPDTKTAAGIHGRCLSRRVRPKMRLLVAPLFEPSDRLFHCKTLVAGRPFYPGHWTFQDCYIISTRTAANNDFAETGTGSDSSIIAQTPKAKYQYPYFMISYHRSAGVFCSIDSHYVDRGGNAGV